MDSNINYWFVGATYEGSKDQTEKFVREGIWINGHDNRYTDLVKSVKPGDRIAIKSTYTRKHDVPFDNKGHTVSVMKIKSIGTVTENPGDGKRLKVDWDPDYKPREWYFYTNRRTIWKVTPDSKFSKSLVNFTFHNADQDLDAFRNHPYWRERFGDNQDESRYSWTPFYIELADKLSAYRNRRPELAAIVVDIIKGINGLNTPKEKYIDGESGPLRDICPFTTFAMFNRGLTTENRITIAEKLSKTLDIQSPIPNTFDSIPVVNNQTAYFFKSEANRKNGEIEKLWDFFDAAIDFADTDNPEAHDNFVNSYEALSENTLIKWKLSMGLYWIRPYDFLPLDSQSRQYLQKKLGFELGKSSERLTAEEYLDLIGKLKARFIEDQFPVNSFPEFSYEAYLYEPPETSASIEVNRWKELIVSKIKQLCKDKGEDTFSRKEFLDRYLEDLSIRYPNNNSIENTINRNFQMLRDEGILEFIERGQYRWLEFEDEDRPAPSAPPKKAYSVKQIMDDGCFFDEPKISSIIETLRVKKNIILQGPPGTGKSWLGKKLGYALMGEIASNRLRVVQFHPNMSYEDFIRGYRPDGDQGLQLVDGPFLEMIKSAKQEPDQKYIIVIEEINRGNPAQIFGEILTLLEADKRTPDEAMELTYKPPGQKDEVIYLPENLYLIGTMNLADRSLAMVDFALRRRFAFIDLEPAFGEKWRTHVSSQFDISINFLKEIERKITSLNEQLADSPELGKQFQIGHSYFTPQSGLDEINEREWLKRVVDTEIIPLLEEYWFDNPDLVEKAKEQLLDKQS